MVFAPKLASVLQYCLIFCLSELKNILPDDISTSGAQLCFDDCCIRHCV